MHELRLVHLTYAGHGKPDATVDFDAALTVIYGASDTGKSFIAESIEYMLGGAKLNLVSEAEGYSQILLGLKLPDGSPLTLVRVPGTNTIHIHRADLRRLVTQPADTDVTATHTVRSKNSLSLFLLAELGLADLNIRKNEVGETRAVTLSDLVYLSVVPETRMVSTLSPVLRSPGASGNVSAASVMRLLLTGDGDLEYSTGLNAGERRVAKGQINLIDQLVQDLHRKLTTNENVVELRARQVRLQTSIDQHASALRAITDRHLRAVTERMRVAEELASIEVRLTEVGDLISRFQLLEAQYRSDLDRLKMVAEAGSLLGYFRVGTCVFCGAEPEHQNPGHGEHESTQLHIAVHSETTKTSALLADLIPTIQDLSTQFADINSRRTALLHTEDRIAQEIAETEHLLEPMRERMDDTLQARSTVERNLELHARIEELDERRSKLDGKGALPTTRRFEYVPSSVLFLFDQTLRRTLDAWTVPSVEYAEYDQYAMDVRAGGRLRASRGKGVRSVLHSAFTAALAEYCLSQLKPHPGFVVLDSPVVTYRDPISDPVGEDVDLTSSVVDEFYRHMLDFPGQAVIIENGDPPVEVIAHARVHQFTGAGPGRSGFFPAP